MKTRWLSIIIALVLILFVTTPVFAAFLTNPNYHGLATSYSSNVIKVFRNLAETGDTLYIWQYDIDYASTNTTYPTVTATDSIYMRVYDSTGNLKVEVYPYTYSWFESNGYGQGIASAYFGASDNAAAWGSAATLTIGGWPAYFTGLVPYNYTLVADDYTTSTTQEDNQDELKALVLLFSSRLESFYSSTDILLKTSSDNGEVLSPQGETYFGGAIPGLQSLCPELYFIQTYIPVNMDTSYNMTMADTYKTRYDTSNWAHGFEHMGVGLGVSGTIMALIIFAGCSIGLCVWTIKKDWGIEPGAAVSGFIGLSLAFIMGDWLFALLMIAALVAAIGLVWLLLLRRVG